MGEVARAAGVSQSTVSRVVNGNPRVDPEVRRKVEREIRRLGYVPNMAARTLVTRRSDSVGVVIPEPASRIFGDPFFAQVLRGISGALNARRQRLVLLIAEDQEQERWLAPYLMAGHVDGIIMYSLHGDDPLPEELRQRGIQVVVGGLPPRGTRVSYVDTDNVGGALAATSHLIRLGRKVVTTLAGPQDMVAGVDRLAMQRHLAGDMPPVGPTEDAHGELGAARAHQPGDADDLAPPHIEVDPLDHLPVGMERVVDAPVFHLEDHITDLWLPRREPVLERPADHR